MIVTLGIFLVINALAPPSGAHRPHAARPGARRARRPVGAADGPPRLAIRYSTLAIWVTWPPVPVLLFFFQKTKLGLGYRAVAANRESSQLVGVPVGRMLMLGWASRRPGHHRRDHGVAVTNSLDFNLMLRAAVRLRAAALGASTASPARWWAA